jgi:hypothetical protein
MTCLLRQRLGRYGAMQIVRETPLQFIPVSLHCPASPKLRSSASARSAPIGRADERLRV